jgi:hypothetical protein
MSYREFAVINYTIQNCYLSTQLMTQHIDPSTQLIIEVISWYSIGADLYLFN